MARIQQKLFMSTVLPSLSLDREKIARFCLERGIRRMSLFGSVLRDGFDPTRSDVDVLIDLPEQTGVGLEYFGWGEELGEILRAKVDLCSRLNRHIDASVRREAVTVYEQP